MFFPFRLLDGTFNTLKYSLVCGAIYLSGVKSVQLEKGITKHTNLHTRTPTEEPTNQE